MAHSKLIARLQRGQVGGRFTFSPPPVISPALATENLAMAPAMSDGLPIVLVPGLTCSARLYADQIPALWRSGPVTVADHTRDDSMAAIARRILAAAPPRFALAGLSMGGYIAFEIMRRAGAGRQARAP